MNAKKLRAGIANAGNSEKDCRLFDGGIWSLESGERIYVAKSKHDNLAALCATGEVAFYAWSFFRPNVAVNKSSHVVV